MATLLAQLWDDYRDLMANRSDPRVGGWFLMSSPIPVVAICASYVLFAKWLGPRFMRSRAACNPRKAILTYNLVQVVASVWMMRTAWRHGWSRYSLRCQPTDYSSDNADELIMLQLSWWYFFNKIVELLDTAFFVARKKFDQVSNLHVIHHGAMPFFAWWVVKFVGTGHATFIGLINNFIHCIMYAYYFLAALGPQVHKYLWWKKYLTSLQIVQFVIVFAHQFQLFFIDCDVPKVMAAVFCFNSIGIFALFANFYYQAYSKGRRLSPALRKQKEDDDDDQTVNKTEADTKLITESSKDERHSAVVNRFLRCHTPERHSRA